MFIDETNLVYPEGSVYQPASFHRMYPKCFKRFPVCSLSPQHSLTPWALEIIQRDIIVEQALGNLTVISKRARRHSRRNSRLNSAATAPVLSAQSYVSFLCIPLYLLYGCTSGKRVMPLWKDTLPRILSAAGVCLQALPVQISPEIEKDCRRKVAEPLHALLCQWCPWSWRSGLWTSEPLPSLALDVLF